MSRGAKPGEPRGGRRKGTPNKPKVDALAAELLARAPNPPAPTPHAAVQKRAKDTMTEFAALFASIAAAYQPIGKDENGWPIFRDNGHRENFLAFSQKAMVYRSGRRPTRIRLIERSPSRVLKTKAPRRAALVRKPARGRSHRGHNCRPGEFAGRHLLDAVEEGPRSEASERRASRIAPGCPLFHRN
jgi:hypothetical protein